MKYEDGRTKRIVFINHCLLNQNSRGPGVAFRKGPSAELIRIFLKNDINMIQLPCCECIGWGGAARMSFDRFIPIVINAVRFGWFPLLIPILKASSSSYNRLCKKEAVKVVDRMEDYLRNDYTICGVVGINDSPTCGVTKTVDMVKYMRSMATAIYKGDPVDPIQKNLEALIDGESFFMGNLIKEMKKRHLAIKAIGYEPWAKSLKTESERVATLLNLQI